MSGLKEIGKASINHTIEMAERYRLLNQPRLAQSICMDILTVDPKNQQVLVILLLALTDQYRQEGYSVGEKRAEDVIVKLDSDYKKNYYSGIILERKAEASVSKKVPGFVAYQWFRQAMKFYEKAKFTNRTRFPFPKEQALSRGLIDLDNLFIAKGKKQPFTEKRKPAQSGKK